MTFQNSVVGGVTLVRPAIQSPDYTEGAAGWTINQDGSAEFNDITIRGGTVVSGLALYYDGTPGLGNLILSIAAAAGVDEFGNSYDQGLTIHDSSGSKIIAEAGGGSSTISFVPPDRTGISWQAGGAGQALSSRLGTNTPQTFMASPYSQNGLGSGSSISLYGNPGESNGDVSSEIILSSVRTTIFSPNVWLTGGPIQMYAGNNFSTWTPVVSGGGAATFDVTDGWYQRLGKMVYVYYTFTIGTAGTGTSAVTTTLPITPWRGTASRRQFLPGDVSGISPEGPITGQIFAGSTGATLQRIQRSDGTDVTGVGLTAGSIWILEGWIREA